MNVKLENYLCRRFAPFFEGKKHSFEFSDGWFFILHWTFQRIEDRITALKYQFPEKPTYFVVTEVKEKLGIISFEFKGGEDYAIQSYIDAAQSLSSFICEETGIFNEAVGVTLKGWQKTLSKDQAGFNTGWRSKYDNDLLAIIEEIKIK